MGEFRAFGFGVKTLENANTLLRVIEELKGWQARNKGQTKGRCLEAVRYACLKEHLTLPPPMARPRNTALCNFEEISKNPERWGWRRWSHKDFPGLAMPPALVYFKGCGILPDGRVAGHIALYNPAENTHTSNATYVMSRYWVQRLIGAFVLDV